MRRHFHAAAVSPLALTELPAVTSDLPEQLVNSVLVGAGVMAVSWALHADAGYGLHDGAIAFGAAIAGKSFLDLLPQTIWFKPRSHSEPTTTETDRPEPHTVRIARLEMATLLEDAIAVNGSDSLQIPSDDRFRRAGITRWHSTNRARVVGYFPPDVLFPVTSGAKRGTFLRSGTLASALEDVKARRVYPLLAVTVSE